MVLRRKKVDPLKSALTALYNVRASIQRLDSLIDRISSRRSKLMDMAVDLQARGETFLAKRYAEEIAKLDKMRSRLEVLKLVLEKVSLSIDLAITMRDFKLIADEVSSIVSEIKKIPESRMPDLAVYFAELDSSIRELASADIDVGPPLSYDTTETPDVRRVLEEARSLLKTKLESENIQPPGLNK
ncbi:hypothetical protein TCELL_1362 [Thermogladius calderae 1633]|uniref:Uncharacterized protein n=1 Tax=Thermogladius calderae (strain DSM 22663 / VKM B-2946 / 1633) TaxID=1184251 RepID=I3TG96_THEC1|nr:hypothetical protein [Thermogladius calderae]AFK51784.1 hypothetical protein TCELL_1362 [Thermogladius calderae 1633]